MWRLLSFFLAINFIVAQPPISTTPGPTDPNISTTRPLPTIITTTLSQNGSPSTSTTSTFTEESSIATSTSEFSTESSTVTVETTSDFTTTFSDTTMTNTEITTQSDSTTSNLDTTSSGTTTIDTTTSTDFTTSALDTTTSGQPSTNPCQNVSSGVVLPDPENCAAYLICIVSIPNRYLCEPNMIFSEEFLQCIPGNQETCEPFINDQTCEGRFFEAIPYPGDDSLFIGCIQGHPIVMQCDHGETFDSDYNECR